MVNNFLANNGGQMLSWGEIWAVWRMF